MRGSGADSGNDPHLTVRAPNAPAVRKLDGCAVRVLSKDELCRYASGVPEVKFAPLPGISRSHINRCGETLREWWMSEEPDGDGEFMGEVIEAFRVMILFRETFQGPMNKTAAGLRSMVKSEWPELQRPEARIPVVQRLKRREQIINKLVRLPGELSNMGDIGGCRAVLQDRDMVDRVARRIRKNWTIHGRVRDRRDEPAESGYRGLHFIVVRDGRRVEIQLRDRLEQEWAVAVERTGARIGVGLKEGEGPPELKEYFRLASLGMYRESQGEVIDDAFRVKFNAVRDAARPYFRR